MPVVRGDNSLFFATGLDNSGLRKGSVDALGIIQNMSTKIAKINPFAALAIGAVAAFATISAQAYKMSNNFEHAMKEVETISAATQKNFKDISQSVFELTKITPDGPEKLAKAYYQIVSAGFDGAKGLKLLETASKSAVAGVTDTVTAADGITTVLNAFKIEAEDSNRVADIMFKTVQLGKTTFSELASNISTVAPIAAASGVSFEQVAGAVATLTKQGVPTAQAMTQIRSAIIGTNEALGDGWSQTMTLQNAFQLLYDKANGSQTVLQEMVGRVEAVSGVLGIAGQNAQGATTDLEAMNKAVGSSEEAFKRMASSNVNQWDILRNRIRATTKGIGDAVLEMSNGIAKFLNKAIEDGNKLEESYNKQREELFKLKGALQSVNVDSEERKVIVKQIIEAYPDYLKGIDSEKVSNEQLLTVLDQVNEAYKLRYKYEQRATELQEALQKQGDLEISIEDSETKFREALANLERIAEDNGVKLEIDFTQSDSQILKSVEEQLKGVDGAFDVVLDSGDKFKNKIEGFAQSSINALYRQANAQFYLNKSLDEQKSLVEDLTDRNQRLNTEQWNNANNQIEAIRRINEATSNSELLEFSKSTIKAVQEAYEARKVVIDQLQDISGIKTAKGLSDYLKSENEEIKKAAQERYKLLNKNFSGGGSSNEEANLKAFIESLKIKEEQYNAYNLAIANKDSELAEKLKSQYKLKEEDYITFLRNLYSETEETYNQIEILNALGGVSLSPREKAEAISGIKPEPIVFDVVIDQSSINFLERQIESLEEKRKAALSQSERDQIQVKIDAYKKRLEVAEKGIKDETGLYGNLTRSLSDLNNKALRDYIEYWKKKLAIAKKGSAEAAEAEGNIQSATEQIGQNTAETLNNISGVLGEASSLFRKFGDEDLANLLDQLGGVADGVAQIASGNIIGGGLQVLNSVVTVEIDSDTAKFEAVIKDLEKAIDKLDYVIGKSVGLDRISNRTEAIDDLAELEEQIQKAKDAELKARKEVKVFGITVGKKGQGSGTDPAKLEELEQKAEAARRKAEELKDQLDELYTGTTETTIVDSIIAGLREGRSSVADFANDFKRLMQDALLQAFQTKYLEAEIAKFYDAFAEAGSDSNYTASEIQALQDFYNQIIDGAQSDIDAINAILEETGIGGLGTSDSQPGLSGAVRREITEETAGELAGLFRNQLDTTKQHFEVAQQHLNVTNNIAEFSERIANNTELMVERLDNAVAYLQEIAETTEEHYLLDVG